MRSFLCGLVIASASACASPTLANPGGNQSAGCTPTIVGQPTVVVPAVARQADSALVLPAGVVGPTGFDFSDTPMGVVKSLDGSHYLFFGSDGSCHANCNVPGERDGSITRTVGTLDN